MSAVPPPDPHVIEANLAPIDFAIFAALPDEGSHLGYHPLYKTAKQVTADLNKDMPPDAPKLRTSEVATRIRVMHLAKLVVPVRALAGSILGWQRPPRAKELLARRDEGRQS
jgi:hypothetical protein